jgi:dTDP-glucose pyrophosphorylase/predicted transcriptional regulator
MFHKTLQTLRRPLGGKDAPGEYIMKNLKRITISRSSSILKAVQMIDSNSMQVALVVDGRNRLLGTITDGDVRRAVLKGILLTERAERIMNRQPVVAKQGDSQSKILSLMKQRQIHQLPILDVKGRVIGVEILDQILKSSSCDHWVVLMAGGLGNRLSPLTDHCPKPLLNVGKQPILQTILENFIEHGFKRFFIAVNYKNEMVKDYFRDGSQWGVQIQYLHEKRRLGTAGALSLLPDKPKQSLFVMNGDLLTKVNFKQLLDFHYQNKAKATMCVREYDFQVPYGVVKIEKGRICGVDEKPAQRFFVNAGIYVLEPELLKWVPTNSFFDMPQLFDELMRKKKRISAFPIREYWLDIGRMDDLEKAHGEYEKVFE